MALVILGYNAIGVGLGSAATITGLSGGTVITVAGAEAAMLTYAGAAIMIEAEMGCYGCCVQGDDSADVRRDFWRG